MARGDHNALHGGPELKTIGLIGGMSWQSTLLYYRIINEAVQQRLGGLHSAPLILDSVDFQPLEELQRAGDWAAVAARLVQAARSVERAGADFLVVCSNTMHCVAEKVEAAVPLPLLHMADVTAAAIVRSGLSRVALLGTRFTMEQPFFRERLAAAAIEAVIPGASERETIHRVIYDELCRGELREASRATFRQFIARLVGNGVQGVILGCTEISLLLADRDATVPLFDTTRIHALAAVDFALSGD